MGNRGKHKFRIHATTYDSSTQNGNEEPSKKFTGTAHFFQEVQNSAVPAQQSCASPMVFCISAVQNYGITNAKFVMQFYSLAPLACGQFAYMTSQFSYIVDKRALELRSCDGRHVVFSFGLPATNAESTPWYGFLKSRQVL